MLRRVYDATWGRGFALAYDRLLRQAELAGLADIRRDLLSGAGGRTLELGAGTGLNLAHYPDAVTELVLTEPFEPMAKQLRDRAGARAEVVEAPAEAIPFPDDSFDTVVVTLVLCNVDDQAQVLREVARVLRPGGRFLFLEHVRAAEPRLARWQDRLHGPWYVFGHGCHCNRDTRAAIDASPLTIERTATGEFPKSLPIVRPLLHGVARSGPTSA